jgi:hypothetical protein
VRTLTENPGNQGVANRVGTVRTADPTGFHQSGHMSRAFCFVGNFDLAVFYTRC